MIEEDDIKFITDINLGKLATRLRLLGYDTLFYRGAADHKFLRKAEEEKRVILTRKKDLIKRQFKGVLHIVENDHVEKQVQEVLDKLILNPEPARFFTICPKCNVSLLEILKQDILNRVPPYVFENHILFMTCPQCGAIFWPGTHRQNAWKWIKALHIPIHHR
jgi:uncharacterized protein with PIN domain